MDEFDETEELNELNRVIPLIGKTPDIVDGYMESHVIDLLVLLAKYKYKKKFEYTCKCISETPYTTYNVNFYMLQYINDQKKRKDDRFLNIFDDFRIETLIKYTQESKFIVYETNVSEPWFSLIQLGIKKVEGRLNKGKFADMNIGDFILFTNNDLGFERKFKIQIKNISYYNNFQIYLKNETLDKCLPGIDSIENGLKVYYKYYKESDEKKYKIKAFTF